MKEALEALQDDLRIDGLGVVGEETTSTLE